MALASWIRNWKRSLERRWSLHQTLRSQSVARHRAIRPRLEALEDRWLLSSYVVNSTADDGSKGTLRDAINQANATGSTITEIDFAIGTSGSAQTIDPNSQLPALTATGVLLNGLSPGGSNNTTQLITLNGTSAGSDSDGLILHGLNNTVSGLTIEDFTNNDIEIEGNNNTIGGTTSGAGNIISGSSNDGVLIGNGVFGTRVQGNYIGTDITGSKAVANGNGIEVDGPSNTIGGTSAGARNVISGNSKDGILIDSGVTGVPVQGNYLGTDITGSAAVGNNVGIEVDASNITIGGTVSGALDLVSGNKNAGLLIDSGASGARVQGDYIGTDVTGSNVVANGIGILDEGSNTTIGGTTAAARNIISGNSADGVSLLNSSGALVVGNYIGTDVGRVKAVANGIGVSDDGADSTIGGTTSGALNLIAGNTNAGVYLGSSGTLLEGNFIGVYQNTIASDITLLPNGIGVENAGPNNAIGGTAPGAGNLISGNSGDGVFITVASGLLVQGNSIGVVATGIRQNGGNSTGVEVDASGFVLGGTTATARNIISGNSGDGLLIDSGISGVQVQGNYNGTDTTAAQAVANNVGVEVAGSADTIGGTAAGASNLISGNTNDGVLIDASGSSVQVQGNYIGTNAAGNKALVVGFTNGIGVEVGGSNNTVGGATSGAGNLISGNKKDGVRIDSLATGIEVQGNYIGTDVTGSNVIGNNTSGVETAGSNNTIGGTSAAARNLIAGVNADGVLIDSTSSNIAIQGNYIGTDGTGTKALNNGAGVDVFGSNVTIGGTTSGAGNLISGNIEGMFAEQSATGVQIQGNYIGTDVTGSKALGNETGITIVGTDVLVGGTSAAARNIISGNSSGVVTGDPIGSGALVEGNYIGTDVTGTKAVANKNYGV